MIVELRVKNTFIALLLIILSFALPSFSFAQQWRYALLEEPSSYPLRWGEKEPPSEDMVAMPPGLDTSRTIPSSPGCYKVGMSGFVLSYKVEDSILRGAIDVVVWDEITGETYWNQTYPRVPKEGKINLEGLVLPSYITILRFQVSWSGSGTMFTRFSVFVVLDAPKSPMDPAWVNVLRISCSWARGESTPDGAANVLTQTLWEKGTYDPSQQWYTRNETDAGETFYLKSFLSDQSFPRGQCNDFADFLVCLINSVGAYETKAQRTYSFTVVYWGPLDPDGSGWRFQTNEVDPAPSGGSTQKFDFAYHQFTVIGSSVWNGTVKFATGIALGWERDTTYKLALVEWFREWQNHTIVQTIGPNDPGNPWNPTPALGFIPDITAADLSP